MKNFTQISALSETEIQREIEKAERDLFEVKMALAAGSEGDTSKKRKLKKYIARLKTARRQKEIGISFAPEK